MLHPTHAAMLKALEKDIRNGTITPTDRVGPGTLLCVTQATPHGMAYHQLAFDSAPPEWSKVLIGTVKGEKLGDMKIVAIFDIWPEMPRKKKGESTKTHDN